MEAVMVGGTCRPFRVMRRRICRLLSPTKPGPVDDHPPVLYMPSTSLSWFVLCVGSRVPATTKYIHPLCSTASNPRCLFAVCPRLHLSADLVIAHSAILGPFPWREQTYSSSTLTRQTEGIR